MMANKIKMVCMGIIRFVDHEVIVSLDETNSLVNYFIKSADGTDVECYQVKKSYMESFQGEKFMKKAIQCWMHMWSDVKKIQKHAFLQTFPLGFWDDIVVPMTKCDENSKAILEGFEEIVRLY